MGVDCRLVLRATIEPGAGKQLAAFCRDWHHEKYLSEPEKKRLEPPFLDVYERCESLFESVLGEDVLQALEEGRLAIDYEGGFDTDAVETMESVFLPKVMKELGQFFYEIPEFGTRVDLSWDAKKRELVKTRGVAREEDDADASDWDEEYGALPRAEWRSNLAELLELVADAKLQKEVLVERSTEHDFDPPYTDFEIWFDINAYYIGRLNLDAGLEWAQEEGFISSAERQKLAAFDEAFRNFLPDNMGSEDARPILESKPWQAIVKLAQGLSDLFR